jgi:hypothetical protein
MVAIGRIKRYSPWAATEPPIQQASVCEPMIHSRRRRGAAGWPGRSPAMVREVAVPPKPNVF